MRNSTFVLALILSFPTVSNAQHSHEQSPVQQNTQGSAHDGMHQAMTSMCKDMESMPMSGNLEKDFVMMMIPHHQSAVEMATAYLSEGKDPELVKLARKIIKDQEKEISEMNTWLSDHK